MQAPFSRDDIDAIRTALLAFFDSSARPLPWRQSRDPYAVWVSEIMSQQTRVEVVAPYYERWLSRFPDLTSLAEAPPDDVLKAWEGLGYYSRARNLHAAAQIVRERHGGNVPDEYDALRALPGIGEYTAGAVSSIAFGARRAAVDGNVRRVVARLLDEPAPSPALLRAAASALVPAERPGDFNQALMELGATICTPRAPRCGRCPIADRCAARASGTQQQRPLPRLKKAVPTVALAAAVVSDPAGRLLIVRRPDHGLLAGMWCFPAIELRPDDDPAQRATDLAAAHAISGRHRFRPRPLCVVEHTFSHRRERYHCYTFEATDRLIERTNTAWIGADDDTHALPRAQQRIRALALARQDEREEQIR